MGRFQALAELVERHWRTSVGRWSMASGRLWLLVGVCQSWAPAHPERLGSDSNNLLVTETLRCLRKTFLDYNWLGEDLHLKGAEEEFTITSFLK